MNELVEKLLILFSDGMRFCTFEGVLIGFKSCEVLF